MKAMILAAGLGTRLRPVTDTLPKILVQVAGIPAIDRLLDHLTRNSIAQVAINTHHLAEQVDRYVEELSLRLPLLTVRLFHEPDLLGTGGALVNIRDFWGEEPLLVWNGDVLADVGTRAMLKAHQASGALATLLVQDRRETSHLLIDEADWVRGVESPQRGGRRVLADPVGDLRPLAFNGISLLSPELLPRIERPAPFDLIDALLAVIADGGHIAAHDHGKGFWGTTGTAAELLELETMLDKKQQQCLEP